MTEPRIVPIVPITKRELRRILDSFVIRRPPRPLESFPEMMTPAEVAEVLRIGRTKLYEALSTGEIPCVRVGSQIRVARRAVAIIINGKVTKNS